MLACLRSFVVVSVALLSASAFGDEIRWKTKKLHAQGNGCEFAGPKQNAWAIAAGNELSLVYSKLGQKFRERKEGVEVSFCDVMVPVELSLGFYVSAVEQIFLFGITKQKGVDVEVTAVSNFARVGYHPLLKTLAANEADLRKTTAKASLSFGAKEEVVRALDEVAMPLVHIRPDGDPNAPFERLCAKNRMRDLHFYSSMRVRVVKSRPNAEVSIAIDGQDLRLNMKNVVSECPRG
jgi:hypothetical protein